ncbi:MAG: hypothetical protein Q8K93_32225 [Reyranella sp.]|uniref:hypothetical protein n=1 Tax=Reyranella sp. TaxID=1929291 RepID=UPI00272F63EE|nr:hypothetical protein [Reyranella sp.]MDP1966860.1 hypothetical protein [Reyranella sp.]MDP2376938.1 hypothetical protein [Reyranella sp.]
MTSLEAFLIEHLPRFGLTGSNNQVPADIALGPIPPRDLVFTKDNHFDWGFGADAFNRRTHGVDRYWTEYGRPARPHEGFRAELIRALREIADRHGRIGITADGGYVTESAMAAAKAAGIPFEQVVIEVEGFRVPAFDAAIPTQVHRVSQDQLRDFSESFGHEAGCGDAWLALEAMHGARSPLPHIYDGTEVRLVNNAYDERRKAIAGPANWSLVDNEQFTAINRFLLLANCPGVPSILRWSPELMAAQLDSPQWRDWLRASSRPMAPAARTTWLNQAARVQLAMDAFPGVPMTTSMGARRNDPTFAQFMRGLSVRMSRRDVSFGNQHCWPLDRLAERLGVSFDFPFGKHREVYGHVDAA